MIDIINKISVATAVTQQTIHAATVNGSTVNVVGYNAAGFAVSVGVPGDTLSSVNKYEIDVQENLNGDGSTWTAAADINVQYAVGTANGATNTGAGALLTSGTVAQTIYIGYLGNGQNIRLVVIGSGTLTTGTVFSAVAVLGEARHQPTNAATQLP